MSETYYRNMPFTTETPQEEFYTYFEVNDLANKCERCKEVFRCRTLGILQSINGRYYISDIDALSNTVGSSILVSVAYLQTPPPSTTIPYAVQVFGTVQWKHKPVIFATILQVMNTAMAVKLRYAMNTITRTHLATGIYEEVKSQKAHSQKYLVMEPMFK